MMSSTNSTRVKAPDLHSHRLTQGLDHHPVHDDAPPLKPIGKSDGPPTAGRTPLRNPIRRDAANNPADRRALLHAKKKIGIGTWNVRTLHQPGNLELLIHQLENYKWEIMGISETHWIESGDFTQDGYQILSAGSGSTHRAGVALILNKNAQRSLLGYNPISERLITARLRTQIGTATIMQVYAPTTSYPDEDIEDFYDQLQLEINKTPSQDILIIMGDFNAKVGIDWEPWNGVIGKFGIGEANDRGEKLLSFCSSNSLCITNTLFKESKPSRQWTWESPDGSTRNKIDFILIRQNGKRQTYSDYQVTIGGKFNPLIELPDTDIETEELWQNIKSGFNETADKVLGAKKPQRQKPWLTAEVLKLTEERSKVKQERLKDNSKKPRYNFLNREIKRKCKECKEVWLQNLCKDVEHANDAKKTKEVYTTIKTITGSKSTRMRGVKDKGGEVLTDDKKIKDRWKENYEELYNQPIPSDTSILQSLPSTSTEDIEPHILKSEVELAIKRLKGNKAAGEDGISAEEIKAAGEAGCNALLKLCNKIWESEVIPEDWGRQSLSPYLRKRIKWTVEITEVSAS
ncbi:uncharacterized protein [Amphiura filiformis]|uniref:uncharacterized protein n=2 Tax=Amphiura filiformis TaxID=82378 RepID=UPI003B2172D7